MIYLISDINNGYCKVGYSENPFKRLNQLKTGNSSNLVLESVLLGDVKKEKEIHALFSSFRVNREWFFFRTEIRDYFNCGSRSGFDNFEIFPKFVSSIVKFKGVSAIKLLMFMIKDVEKNCIRIKMSHTDIKNKSAEMGIGERMAQNALKSLYESGIVLKPSRGRYYLNPQMLFNGDKNTRIVHLIELYDKGFITD